jgi:hypothetical protein
MPCLLDAAIRAASHQGDIGSGVLEGDELAARGDSRRWTRDDEAASTNSV